MWVQSTAPQVPFSTTEVEDEAEWQALALGELAKGENADMEDDSCLDRAWRGIPSSVEAQEHGQGLVEMVSFSMESGGSHCASS